MFRFVIIACEVRCDFVLCRCLSSNAWDFWLEVFIYEDGSTVPEHVVLNPKYLRGLRTELDWRKYIHLEDGVAPRTDPAFSIKIKYVR